MERRDLILAALFLWITIFFAALSVLDIASRTSSFFPDLNAARIEASSLLLIWLLTVYFLLETRRARFAVFVTGIAQV